MKYFFLSSNLSFLPLSLPPSVLVYLYFLFSLSPYFLFSLFSLPSLPLSLKDPGTYSDKSNEYSVPESEDKDEDAAGN